MEKNEHQIMRDSCHTVKNPRSQDRLFEAIRGKKSYQRFRSTLQYLDIEDDWYRFKGQALEEIAAAWLEENDTPYVRNQRS